MRLPAILLAAVLAVTGCGNADGSAQEMPMERATMVPDARKTPLPAEAEVPQGQSAEQGAEQGTASTLVDDSVADEALRAVRLLRGVDVSHHQGAIDWQRVAADRIDFAWLKATEGDGFVDPTYAGHRNAASEAGLLVGAYHYFSICDDGTAQAEHFVDVVGDQSDSQTWLAPAVDVELDPECDPTRAELLARLRDFLSVAEAGTGRTLVVYAFPDLEQRYRVTAALDRPKWVRRLGNKEPRGNWLVWQKSQTATVDGISRPVDLDLMHP